MLRHQSPLACLALGLFVTLAQIAFALGVANPEGTLAERYLSLVQHDSYWFANIIDRGYGTTVPPSEPKEMEVSNVAFFPAYPLLAGALKRVTRLETYPALLVTAQLATWGFWTYFFLFCQRWELPKSLQVFGALALAAHPAAFYLVAGYSESLFLMTLVGFIYWSTSERRGAKVFAVMHGFAMSATRIVGLVCATFPVVQALFRNDSRPNEKLRDRIARYRAPLLIVLFSMLGGVTFFLYCQVRWGRWDLYLLTQESGWAIDADYGAIFKPENYHFALPPLDDTTAASQFTSAVAGAAFCRDRAGRSDRRIPPPERLAPARGSLFFGRGNLLHFIRRGRFGAAGKHAALRSLRARACYPRIAPLPAGIPDAARVCAGAGHGRGRTRLRRRTRFARILCLELHSGKLGRLKAK